MTWYSTGTVATSANSAVVSGTGTAWTNSGLRPGDMLLIGYSTISPRGFEIKSIDSATQITLVLPFPVAVAGAGYVGIPMLGGDRTAMTMTLANQVSKALADTEAMSAVYQTFYTSPGSVSLTLPGGLVISGSSFQKLTADMSGKAASGANSDIISLSGLTTPLSLSQGGVGSSTKEGARTTLGLGTAATASVGTGGGQIPDMSSFTSSKASNGWQRLPGGLIIQWASFVPGVASGAFNPSFPIAFPTGTLQLTMSVYDDFDSHAIVWRRTSNNQLTNWQVGLFGGNAYLSVEMIAIGY